MRERATKAAVRRAYELLGKDVSLDKLVDVVGGSKTTVSKHRRAIVKENAIDIPDPVYAFLQQQTKTIIERLWSECLEFASQSFQESTEAMMTIQAELMNSLEAARIAEAEAMDRAGKAEALVEQLQSELVGRKSAEEHMAALAKMLRTSEDEPAGSGAEAAKSVRPIDKLLELLQPRPMHPVDYRRHMREAGYTSNQANQAKAEATKRRYVDIDKVGFLQMTALGHERQQLGPKRRAA